jgi:hypothetical protein
MILKYQKATTTFTTYRLREPDIGQGDPGGNEAGLTELCTIDGWTYVFVPDDAVLPEQPPEIDDSIEAVTLSAELREEIKAASPIVRLSYRRLQERIRSRYSIEDEQYLTRISIGSLSGTYTLQEDEPALISAYQAWVEECREIARQERASLGL